MSSGGSAVAGWYRDPSGNYQERWWDGAQWTNHVRGEVTVPGAPAVPPSGSEAPLAMAADRTTESDEAADPELEDAASWARYYGSACVDVVKATNACLEVANKAFGARNMADQRPQHDISIKHFTDFAEKMEQEFVPLCRAFIDVCATARDIAANFLATQSSHDPELVLLTAVPDEVYGDTGIASHILRANFGSTPSSFIDGLQQANAAIQADIFHWGEDGFLGHIYRPPAPAPSDERACPWCAETIKAAAVICRFCGREV